MAPLKSFAALLRGAGLSSAFAAFAWGPREKIGRALGDPFGEACKVWVVAERFWRVEMARKFRFGQCGVDLFVTDMVHEDSWAALTAFEFGNKVVQALRDAFGDWAQAEGANRIGHLETCGVLVTSGAARRPCKGESGHGV